ncbi:MAG: hypothetical protein AAFQ63_00590 [Cyanobacteria bacterium J06621_11]
MGKQKIDRLLAQIKDNHTQDIQNAAAIFTVAQAAVNDLKDQDNPPTLATEQAVIEQRSPIAPLEWTKNDLIRKYGSYNKCRQAAKQSGITFSRSPRWPQIIAAFNYLQACQSCIDRYIEQHPNADLQGTKITLTLGK